jgi:uncharacterized repeat protein (TIGR03803 family)
MKRTTPLLQCALIALLIFTASSLLAASNELVLHSFAGTDGELPSYAALVSDAAGNLYGATYYGGANTWGAVFELQPQNGKWVQKVLYSFDNQSADPYQPESNLIFDRAGNLYGTTTAGGADGAGTVFELTPNKDGSWSEKTLHSFASDAQDGSTPYGGLIFDNLGNLYGTTYYGGSGLCAEFETTVGCGIVFELTPNRDGTWSETILHTFQDNPSDGHFSRAGLVRDGKGNLYGTTAEGGTSGTACDGGGCGTVFELTSTGNGQWIETILHNFEDNGSDGYQPITSLVLDSKGNLYGTTPYGGSNCPGGYCGVAFELALANGQWTETVLHTFSGASTDGLIPIAGLVLDPAGNLYGTTDEGGQIGFGTAFKLARNATGKWVLTLLHSFPASSSDGSEPSAGLAFGKGGNLFGTAYYGGANNLGVIFSVAP